MKKLVFWIIAIAIIICALHAYWSILLAFIALGTAIFLPELPKTHSRFQDMRHHFRVFEEGMQDHQEDKELITRHAENTTKAIREMFDTLDREKENLEKETDEEIKKRKLDRYETLRTRMTKLHEFIQNDKKSSLQFFEEMEYFRAHMFKLKYDEYMREDLLYYYHPSVSVMKRIETAIEQFRAGTFFVRLEKVDESKKIELMMTIKNITKLGLKETKDKVDAVRLGSMSIIASKINKKTADEIKEAIEQCGGTAVVVDDTPIA